MTAEIRFVYFDLGNVILHFDNDLICSQLAEVAEVPVDVVLQFLRTDDYQNPLERGERTFDEVYEKFCDYAGKRPDKQNVEYAVSNIFSMNAEILPIVSRLSEANVRMGILSNTSAMHWRFVTDGRYGVLPSYFEVHALSFEIGCMKPDRRIFEVAADLAQVAPEQILFTDDRPENVEGAKRARFDAVLFQNPLELASALKAKGIGFNY
jgi:HAD superfamily hydrolase (TIGR01509 family)